MAILKPDTHIQILLPNGECRFGYIQNTAAHGMEITVNFYEEGVSKIAFEEAVDELQGFPLRDWKTFLTAKEKELIPLLASGLTIDEIANEVYCTNSTIRSQIRNLRIKLQLENKVQLIHYCQGLLKRLNGHVSYEKVMKYGDTAKTKT